MLTIEKLENFGADIKEALPRCLNNEAFYIKMVMLLLKDQGFTDLQKAIDEHDYDKAFEKAHMLKGVLSNLALKPILTPVLEITELLRNKTECNYKIYIDEIMLQKSILEDLSQ